MSTEKMREKFEAWQCDADDGPQTDPMWMNHVEGGNGDYGITEVQRDWVTWQASRATIEIQLPEVKDLEIVGIGCTYEDSFIDYLAAVRAIEDAGLKVKP